MAAETNTFASITTRTGSAGTPPSDDSRLLDRQPHRLVIVIVIVQRGRRTARCHRFTHPAREVLPRRLARHAEGVADLIPRHSRRASFRNEFPTQFAQLGFGSRELTQRVQRIRGQSITQNTDDVRLP